MQFALDSDGSRVEAAKGLAATCPMCQEPLIAKCGRIKVHHWAHHAREDCDAWYEPETEWHRAWKRLFPIDRVEVAMGEHRADIRAENGLVVELQNSSISPSQIQEREHFYGRMIWIVNARELAARFYLLRLMNADQGLLSFKWKHMKQSWRFARRPVYFDLGELCVGDLLGGRKTHYTQTHTLESELETWSNHSLVHYRDRDKPGNAGCVVELHESLAKLPDDIAKHTILRRNTLYENGFGSVFALPKDRLLGLCEEPS